MVNIIKRKIKKCESELVVEKIKSTPDIIGYSSRELISADHIMVAENDEGKILGVCLNYNFHNEWSKIAALFVIEEFRGQGIGKSLFYTSCRDAIARRKNIYTISANPIVIKMMKDLNFETCKNLLRLSQAYRKYQLVFYCHSIQWLVNLYRIKEIIRKRIVYNSKKKFVFGLRLINN